MVAGVIGLVSLHVHTLAAKEYEPVTAIVITQVQFMEVPIVLETVWIQRHVTKAYVQVSVFANIAYYIPSRPQKVPRNKSKRTG